MDRAVHRPRLIRCFAGGYVNGTVDLGRAIAIGRDITSGQGKDHRNGGHGSIAVRRSHRSSPAGFGSLLYQYGRRAETSVRRGRRCAVWDESSSVIVRLLVRASAASLPEI